jgi:hypothetical protein
MKEINIRVKIPQEFSLKLYEHILELKAMNVKPIPTKAELVAKFAQIGYKWERIDSKK